MPFFAGEYALALNYFSLWESAGLEGSGLRGFGEAVDFFIFPLLIMMEREVFPLGGATVVFVTLSALPSKLQWPPPHTGEHPNPLQRGRFEKSGGA